MRPEDLLLRMDQLIDEADEVEQTKTTGFGPRYFEDCTRFRQWMTSVEHVLTLAFGGAGSHVAAFSRALNTGSYPLQFDEALGVMRAARDDVASGLVTSLRDLVAGEIFDDLLDQSHYLLQQGYHLPAAALCGAVLEDALRKLCSKHAVTWAGDSSISKLNTALYTADPQVYGKPQMGQVEAWGKLRNHVDHHGFVKPDDVPAEDVGRMVDGVRDFIVRFLT